MYDAEELKRLTREVLGEGPGDTFYARADRMIEDGSYCHAALMLATREIEKTVRLFIDADLALALRKRYREFYKSHPAYV